MTVAIQGNVAAGFEPVRDAFAANFALPEPYREIGASLCVYQHGERVVDVWGGSADRAGEQPWTADTMVNLWSTTKGIAAMGVARLVDRGALDYQAQVADYWPEFAAAGKDVVTVGQMLSHQAGLPGFAEATALDDLYDQATAADRLARQAPLWEPGTANGYHASTWGVLVAELVRRIDGRPVGRFLDEEVAGPAKADFHLGLPADLEPRRAELIPPEHLFDPTSVEMSPAMHLALESPAMDPHRPNQADWRRADLPALNGHGSARGVARLYDALLGGELISAATLDRMVAIAADRTDLVLGFNPQWGMGVANNGSLMFGPDPAIFGHGGWGGSVGCAHRARGIAIGYALNHMGPELVGDPRARTLCGAVFDCLD